MKKKLVLCTLAFLLPTATAQGPGSHGLAALGVEGPLVVVALVLHDETADRNVAEPTLHGSEDPCPGGQLHQTT